MGIHKEIVEDLYRLQNELEDDLELDLEIGESGAISFEDSYRAVKKHTYKVLLEFVDKWVKREYKHRRK